MQTQCPHCKSRYHLGQEMIDKFGGFVRCGNCQYKFNVHDQTSSTEPLFDAEQIQGSQSSLLDPTARVEPKLDSVVQEEQSNIRFEREVSPDDEREEHVQAAFNEADFNKHLNEPSLDAFTDEDAALQALNDQADEASIGQEKHVEEERDQLDEFYSENLAGDLDEQQSSTVFSSTLDSSLFNESSVVSLINDDTEIEEIGFLQTLFYGLKRLIAFFFWAFAAMALAYLLFGQIKDKLYPAYKNNAIVQKIRAGVCQYAPCGVSQNDLSKYEISFSRMDELKEGTRQLRIKLFILNKAAEEQVYPNILVRLTKLDSTTVGQRVLSPLEYLPADVGGSVISGARFIKPGKLAQVVIVFDHPPEDAVGFEVRLVH